MMHVQNLDVHISKAELLVSACIREKDKRNRLQIANNFLKKGVKALRVGIVPIWRNVHPPTTIPCF